MATYIQGLTDYVPQLQPFSPDFNFLGNILQTRQSKYDAAHKKINGIYGTVLNSPLLRDGNIKRRDEFFKAIDGDIKRISGLDLSLEQNVQQAQEVFRPFFEDKNIINDMTNTKRFYNGLEKHDFLKAANDPNNQAWEEGKTSLLYQADEFKKMSDKDALNFQMGSYVPKYNWQKDAVKLATDAGLSVSQDSVTGNWIVHKENGELIQGGLIGLFKSVYGNDQRVVDNYNTKAYVNRKNYSIQNAQTHGSEEAAETFYLTNQIAEFNKQQPKENENLKDAVATTTARTKQLINKKESPAGLTNKEEDLLNRMTGITDNLKSTQTQVEDSIYKVNNDLEHSDIATLRKRGDDAVAQTMMYQDIGAMAVTMSHKGEKNTLSVNPYGMEGYQQSNREKMAWLNFGMDKAKMSIQARAALNLEDFKHGLISGVIPGLNNSIATPLNNEGLAVVHSTDRTAGIKENAEEIAKGENNYRNMAAPFLYDTFNKAAGYAKINNKGAESYLKNTFGANWRDIKTQADMEAAIKKTGRTLETAFDYTTDNLSPHKNPTFDLEWAQSHMNNSKDKINEIDDSHAALYANINANLETSKKIVNNMQKIAGVKGNEVYADADLLLTKAGMPMVKEDMPSEFAQNYLAKHQRSDPNFSPDKWYSKAQDTYEALRDRFADDFQVTPGSSLTQGAGLAGGGTSNHPGIKYSNIHSNASVLDKGAATTTSILKAVIPNTNDYNVIIGEPTGTNINAQGSNDALKLALAPFLNAAISRGKGNPDIVYNAAIRPVVGGNKDLSGITISAIPEELIKDFRGTEKNKGVLYNYHGEDITMYWDNKNLKTPIDNMTTYSDIETIAKHGGKKYTAFPNALQNTQMTSDESTGGFRIDGVWKGYNAQKGAWELKPFSIPVTGNTEEFNKTFVAVANQVDNENLKLEAELAALRKIQANQTKK